MRDKALTELDDRTAESLRKLDEKTTDGISKISTAGEQTLQDISEAKNDIDGQKSEAISEICNLKKDVLSVITKAGTEAKENVLIGAKAARSDMSGQVVSRETIFQKVRRKLKNAFSPSSSKSHFKVGFLSTIHINLYNLINPVHCLCVAILFSNSFDFCFVNFHLS
jgi:vacuolar-type H+-ATPase subunit H